jgi:hypothetical protein
VLVHNLEDPQNRVEHQSLVVERQILEVEGRSLLGHRSAGEQASPLVEVGVMGGRWERQRVVSHNLQVRRGQSQEAHRVAHTLLAR